MTLSAAPTAAAAGGDLQLAHLASEIRLTLRLPYRLPGEARVAKGVYSVNIYRTAQFLPLLGGS
jgi:hypothetical protein